MIESELKFVAISFSI